MGENVGFTGQGSAMDGNEATAGLVAHGRIGRGHVGRGQRAWSQLWQVPTFAFGVIAFLCVAASSPYRADLREGPFAALLRELRQGLKDAAPPDKLVEQADHVLVEVRRHPRREGEASFLAGSAYHRLAEANPKDVAAQTKALEYLEKALAIGVPEVDVPALHHRLGVTLFRRGDSPTRAVELMAQSVEQGADRPREAYELLAQAQLQLPAPDLDAALLTTQKMLELTDDPAQVGSVRYLRAELLLRKDQRLEAIKELDRITGKVPAELRVKARLLQAQVSEQENMWHRAATCWKELLADAEHVPGGKARLLFAHGHCLASTDPPNHVEAAASWQQALELGGKAGQAAGLRLGELRLFLRPADPVRALAAWTEALKPVRTVSDYQNAHLDVAKARELFERSCRHLLDRREFEHAQQAAELYKKIAVPGAAEERWAEAVEARAQVWKGAAGTDAALLAKTHAEFHRAAVAFEQAALVRKDREQLDACWRSAQCYLAAKDIARAAAALERFVTLAKNDPRLAQAWFSLAETESAAGHKEQARLAYYKCMEFPATPFAWRARYQLALEEIERKNYVHAKEILKQNLTSAGPAIDREAHEKSIYKMAGLLLHIQAYDEAIWYLKEASRQYPNNVNGLNARDHLADCYRKLAEQTLEKIEELNAIKLDNVTPERRAALAEMKVQQERIGRQWVEQAMAVYQSLTDDLQRQTLLRPLVAAELVLKRKAQFGIADMHFDLGNFSEALRLYQRLQGEYTKQVEALIACNKIWHCVSVMVETPEQIRVARDAAEKSVKLARADLEAMPPDSEVFRGEGVWSKANWITWLNWVEQQLNPPPAPAPPMRPNPLVK
jgi:tetratricopeptide (TPR) repeat protein